MGDGFDEAHDGMNLRAAFANAIRERDQLQAEVDRHRAAQAADAERIKSVVRAVITNAFPFTDTDKLNVVADGVAGRLATAAQVLGDHDVAHLAAMRCEFATLEESALRRSEGPESSTYAAWSELMDRLIAAHRPVAALPASTARIEVGLAKLDAEHEPAVGWEQRVVDAAETVSLSAEEAMLAHNGLGVWLDMGYQHAPSDEIRSLRARLQAFIDGAKP